MWVTLGLKKRGFKIGVDGGGKETKKPMKINNYQEPAGEGFYEVTYLSM